MVRRLISTVVAWMSLLALHAANTVEVGSAEGKVGDDISLTVNIDVTSSDVVAAEIHIPLPDGVTPKSCEMFDNRFPNHSLVANLNNGKYVIVLFNTALKPLPVGSGKALEVKLSLGENPGIFNLTPTVKLSDANSNQIECSATGGSLTILGARLNLGAVSVDFGRVAIRSTATKQVTATNTGTTTLTFGKITTTVPGLTVTPEMESLEPGETTNLLLNYAPTVRAAKIDGRFTVNSNSVGKAPFTKVYSIPFSVNELHIGNAQGISDSEVTVAVTMNNMEPIVGAEFSLTLPNTLDFVEGSVELNERAKAMSVATSVDSKRVLRILLFNIANKAVTGEDGELLTFRLKLVGRSGTYYLRPNNVILCNIAGENMVSATSYGYVKISSPKMNGSSTLALGNVPISGPSTFDYNFNNNSSVPLTIEKVNFLNDVAVCDATFPMIVDAYSSGKIPVAIANPELGSFASTMNIYTNDPDNRLKTVAISGNFYTANEMGFSAVCLSGKNCISASLINEREIAALQLDLVVPSGASISSSGLTLASRAATHTATVAQVDKSRYRVIIFSLQNNSFSGNEGDIFSVAIEGENIENKQVTIENIKLSSVNGDNYTTPGSEVKLVSIPVFPRMIELSTTELSLSVNDSFRIEATVYPENAADKEVVWSSSAPNVATVDSDGNIRGVDVGEATIMATAVANSEAVAECHIIVSAISTDIECVATSQLRINIEGDRVNITGLMPSDRIRLYNLLGELLFDNKADGATASVAVSSANVYILLINNKPFKLAIP